jgi:hypothetical protein
LGDHNPWRAGGGCFRIARRYLHSFLIDNKSDWTILHNRNTHSRHGDLSLVVGRQGDR